MRLGLLVFCGLIGVGCVACGQIAPTDPDRRGSTPQDPGSSSPAPGDAPAGGAGTTPTMAPSASAAPTPPLTAGACGVVAFTRSFATADDQAAALHGLWVTCASEPPPGLCAAPDSAMFFGQVDAAPDPASRAAACGHLSSHGDRFIANPAAMFTYEVKSLAPAGSSPTYELHVWNDTADRRFVLTYRDDFAMTGSVTSGTLTLGEPDGKVGTLMHSAFTTF